MANSTNTANAHMDNGSQDRLTVDRLPEGGFVVLGSRDGSDPFSGRYGNPFLATTTLDEALKFVKAKMEPIPSAASHASSAPSIVKRLDANWATGG